MFSISFLQSRICATVSKAWNQLLLQNPGLKECGNCWFCRGRFFIAREASEQGTEDEPHALWLRATRLVTAKANAISPSELCAVVSLSLVFCLICCLLPSIMSVTNICWFHKETKTSTFRPTLSHLTAATLAEAAFWFDLTIHYICCSSAFFFQENIYFIVWKAEYREDREKESNSFARLLCQPELSQFEAKSQELLLGFPHGYRDARSWAILCSLPRI